MKQRFVHVSLCVIGLRGALYYDTSLSPHLVELSARSKNSEKKKHSMGNSPLLKMPFNLNVWDYEDV